MPARLGIALAAACTGAALLYSVLRIAQALLVPEPDPATVLWSEHSGFFWRAWIAAYAAGAIAFVAWLFPDRALRLLARAVVPVAVAVALQAALLP